MTRSLDVPRLARRMTGRFGVGLCAAVSRIDGSDYPCIRSEDLVAPNGFGVAVARTPLRVEASFHPDNYSRKMLGAMSEADEEARGCFASLALAAGDEGQRVSVIVDGDVVDDVRSLPPAPWRRLELEVDARIPGGKVPDDFVDELTLRVVSTCLGLALALLPIEDVGGGAFAGSAGLPEGARVRVEVNRYERSPANRAACIARYGTRCLACSFDFRAVYGELGEGYIEVHHHTPVSAMGGSYRVDPVRDLSPVCANCHAMLHRHDPPISIAELREQLNQRRLGR